ncbi:pilus assembly PilX family protein [Desulfoluna spongiiphila]|uniref:pilus assembly PilX family protein n=1 Tax=Desulfoluna spongiiphila TaxID=419481 RepID=UPI001251B1D5|nr:pilus assembly PilX N-terminal domain-containing protein [Desulfoluna spongiiphila]VVS94961.1 type 4 fimbrial biogenesis protein pilx n-terminal domain [Desulfoluna spongiiphila]
MKRLAEKSKGRNDEGNALLIVMVLLFLVTMIGIASMNNSVVELRLAGSDRVVKRNFYNAEAGLFEAVANFERIYANEADADGNRLYVLDSTNLPLRDRDPENGGVSFASPVLDGDGIPVAWVEVRAIVLKANRSSSGLSADADEVPSIAHIGPAPPGFDKATYRTRRYAVTATAIDPTTYNAGDPTASLTGPTIQCGVDVGEEYDKVVHLVGL